MRIIIKVMLLSILLSCTSVAYSKPVNSGSGMSASSHSEAAQVARQHFGGKVLKVQLESGANSYKVKLLLKDGTVKVVTITAVQKE